MDGVFSSMTYEMYIDIIRTKIELEKRNFPEEIRSYLSIVPGEMDKFHLAVIGAFLTEELTLNMAIQEALKRIQVR